MAPADSLARLREALIDRAERREAPAIQLCSEAGISRSRSSRLRARHRADGEAGLRPKPRPAERYGGRRVSHGGVASVLRGAGLGRRLARLAAAESRAASGGGP